MKKISKSTFKNNSRASIIKNEMINTMEWLYDSKLLYFFNDIKMNTIGNVEIITWNNHIGGRKNCGKSFSTLAQYEHILLNNSLTCILFDGSLIRSTFKFENNKLIGHSHLWWPAPFNCNGLIKVDQTPFELYEELISDYKWFDNINMRSPVRIDYDPSNDTEEHPAVHLHTQHHECRIKVNKPICFNRFIQYIFDNFYPDLDIDLTKLNLMDFGKLVNQKMDKKSVLFYKSNLE